MLRKGVKFDPPDGPTIPPSERVSMNNEAARYVYDTGYLDPAASATEMSLAKELLEAWTDLRHAQGTSWCENCPLGNSDCDPEASCEEKVIGWARKIKL